MISHAQLEARKQGGRTRAISQREEALKRYYESPNICFTCNSVIPIGPDEKVKAVRTKKFCNHTCSAKHSNSHRTRIKRPKWRRPGTKPRTPSLQGVTKGDLFSRYKNWQSARSTIAQHAARIFKAINPSPSCTVCAYNLHVEVAHIQPVSSFPLETLISIINAPENLVGLCPNHHWEFDNGFIKLGGGSGI